MSQTAQPVPDDLRSRWGAPRCGYYSNAAMLWLGTRMLWLAYFFVWFAAIYFYLFAPAGRRASMRYLDLLAAPRRRGRLTRLWQTYRHMVEFGFLLLDRALMLARAGHGYQISAQGLTDLRAATAPENTSNGQPPGAILLSAHFGNAEIAAPYMKKMGLARPVHLVMYLDSRHGTERFHARHRRRLADMSIISTTDPLAAGAKIMAALRKGDIVAMRADRTLAGKGLPVNFLGQPVELPAGPFLASVLSGAPVVYIYTCRLGYRRYSCRISSVHRYGPDQPGSRDQRMGAAAQDFATHLESMLREFPYQWSNFYDYWNQQHGAAPAPSGAGHDAQPQEVRL